MTRTTRGRRTTTLEIPSPLPGIRTFRTSSGCLILVGLEPAGWHLSMSHPDRYPTWDEIADARYELLPDERHHGDAPASVVAVRQPA